ncbi:MAG: cytochrome P460, partial [Terracidiphilus sp.]
AAVDTTFVQFYPTLLPIAQKKGTLSASFLKESTDAAPTR